MPKRTTTPEPPMRACAHCGRDLYRSWREIVYHPSCLAALLMEAKTHPLRPRPPGLDEHLSTRPRVELDELGFPVGY